MKIIGDHYDTGSRLYEILVRHSRNVANYARAIALRKNLDVDLQFVEESAMLHDLGIIGVNAPKILCYGKEPYLAHGLIGAEMLRKLNLESHAKVCERHIGVGLTAQEIIAQNLPLPHKDFIPLTLEEKLVCYADNFFSKSGDLDKCRTLQEVVEMNSRFGQATSERLNEMIALFE